MRCNNCGWDNPGGRAKCEKCNAPLSGADEQGDSGYSQEYPVERAPLKETVFEQGVVSENQGGTVAEQVVTCRACGYAVRGHDKSCPNCGEPIVEPELSKAERLRTEFKRVGQPKEEKPEEEQPKIKQPEELQPKVEQPKVERPKGSSLKTVDPWSPLPIPEEEAPTIISAFTLTILPKEDEELDIQPLSFTGSEIILNRDNTETENQTITSKEQASLTFEDGKWSVEDKSSLKTTFIHVNEKKELKSGDILVLGNRRFLFEDTTTTEK
jgi:hypothetical protein